MWASEFHPFHPTGGKVWKPQTRCWCGSSIPPYVPYLISSHKRTRRRAQARSCTRAHSPTHIIFRSGKDGGLENPCAKRLSGFHAFATPRQGLEGTR